MGKTLNTELLPYHDSKQKYLTEKVDRENGTSVVIKRRQWKNFIQGTKLIDNSNKKLNGLSLSLRNDNNAKADAQKKMKLHKNLESGYSLKNQMHSILDASPTHLNFKSQMFVKRSQNVSSSPPFKSWKKKPVFICSMNRGSSHYHGMGKHDTSFKAYSINLKAVIILLI